MQSGGQRLFPPRLLFSFSKEGSAAYISHLDMMGVFERALARAGIGARFTEGFNPKPRLEFASPLGLGIESDEEIAAVLLESVSEAERFAERMNPALPAGLCVSRCALVREAAGERRKSLMALQWGSQYLLDGRLLQLPLGGTSIRVAVQEQGVSPGAWPRRLRTLARGPGGEPASYFDVLCPPEDEPGERSSALS